MRTQFTARLPEPLAAALAERAQANHRSANAELTAILAGALSGTPVEPYPHGHPLHSAVFLALSSFTGSDTFDDGVRGLITELQCARTDLAPYKAALQRLIDDSAALREKYEDLDEAVEQARGLL